MTGTEARNWKKSKIYCRGCGNWKTNINHLNCPKGERQSLLWIDIENFEMGCSKCNEIWPLEDNEFHCSCGHVQETEYTESEIVLEFGDEIIGTDGDIVYVLQRSGEVVVGRQREFDGVDYELEIKKKGWWHFWK